MSSGSSAATWAGAGPANGRTLPLRSRSVRGQPRMWLVIRLAESDFRNDDRMFPTSFSHNVSWGRTVRLRHIDARRHDHRVGGVSAAKSIASGGPDSARGLGRWPRWPLPPVEKTRNNPAHNNNSSGGDHATKASLAWSGERRFSRPDWSGGDAQAQAALTGLVSSTDEGPMEGVLVSAKKEGSTITTTVVSDQQGALQLPGRAPGARQVHDLDPRDRLPARRRKDRRRRRRAARAGPISSSARSRAWCRSSPMANGCSAFPAPTSKRPF